MNALCDERLLRKEGGGREEEEKRKKRRRRRRRRRRIAPSNELQVRHQKVITQTSYCFFPVPIPHVPLPYYIPIELA